MIYKRLTEGRVVELTDVCISLCVVLLVSETLDIMCMHAVDCQ